VQWSKEEQVSKDRGGGGEEEWGRTREEGQRWRWCRIVRGDSGGRTGLRWQRSMGNKRGRTEVKVVQRSEVDQSRKDRGWGGAEEWGGSIEEGQRLRWRRGVRWNNRGRTEVEVVQRSEEGQRLSWCRGLRRNKGGT
jgi:hypothetical protein